MLFKKHLINALVGTALVAVPVTALTSCDFIYQDLEACPTGMQLRFVYDYNMEFANAFPSQVDCLSLLIYDGEGRYVETRTVTDRDKLGDENWRMHIDLPVGDYTFVAYGGMACNESSFSFVTTPTTGSQLTSLGVDLDKNLLTSPVGTRLHPLFYGRGEFSLTENKTLEIPEGTIYMMKDTNNVRILLQNTDGSPVDNRDFIFEITDNNTSFAWNNDLNPAPTITYCPWTQGQETAGTNADGSAVTLAYAEFSTSRFITDSDARLTIKRKDPALADGKETVLSIPLVEYLLLLRSQEFASMSKQEFLDRESRWDLILFLDARTGGWYQVQIVINGWIVRINNIGDLHYQI
ncbi:MAG: FimB/Mfa2 family fimbrial subunit [Muribaculaceae bacterium]|nr:FimB/Mfa2 family fimbrial subunit [Muribaculaceae bacterium]